LLRDLCIESLIRYDERMFCLNRIRGWLSLALLVSFVACGAKTEPAPAAPMVSTTPSATPSSTATATALTKEQQEAKAAEIAAELAKLDVKTLGVVVPGSGEAEGVIEGPSPPSSAKPKKSTTGKLSAKVIVGSPGFSGGKTAIAAAVMARMKRRFRACYNMGLKQNPEMAGSVALVAKVGAKGEVVGVGGGGGGSLSAIIGCLRAVVASEKFAPPDSGSATVSFPISFVRK
jgi:hypothetical protein